jgi:hypothetical protein
MDEAWVHGAREAVAEAVLIAHSSPSVRVRLAMQLASDGTPLLMANGPGAVLVHLERALEGRAPMPGALYLGDAEHEALQRSPLGRELMRRSDVRVVHVRPALPGPPETPATPGGSAAA